MKFDDLLTWWNSLEKTGQVTLVNTLIDKGILAIIVAFATFVFARQLEKHKSNLSRDAEYNKFRAPRIVGLNSELDALYQLGATIQGDIEKKISTVWEPWIRQICNSKIPFIKSKGPRDLDAVNFSTPLSDGRTYQDYLVDLLQDDADKILLRNFSPETANTFLQQIAALNYAGDEEVFRKPYTSATRHWFYSEFFPKFYLEERKKFRLQANKFLVAAYDVLGARDPKKLEAMVVGQDIMINFIAGYPVPYSDSNAFFSAYISMKSLLIAALEPTDFPEPKRR